MAPKGGGRGGGGGGGGGVSISCSSYAFSDAYSQSDLGIAIVMLVGLLIVSFWWAKKRKTSEGVRTVLRWFSFGLALFFFIMYVVNPPFPYA